MNFKAWKMSETEWEESTRLQCENQIPIFDFVQCACVCFFETEWVIRPLNYIRGGETKNGVDTR